MLQLIRQRRAAGLQSRLTPVHDLDRSVVSPGEIAAWQLERLNGLWSKIIQNVPYYRQLHRQDQVPAEFSSLAAFQAAVPLTLREHLRDDLAKRVDATRPADEYRATGGSTAEPVRIPCWSSEAGVAGDAVWLARSWIGISSADRLFLLWGHSHLFGTGMEGAVRKYKRRLFDWLLGYYRWSAYDMSVKALRAAADRMLRFRPAYFLGYSVALHRFAEANADRAPELRRLKLKAVIPTAEGFPSETSRAAIQKLFGSPVRMEYGAVETGVLAHETAEGCYRTLWQNYLVEAVPNPATPDRFDVVVTSLYPRCLPLVRYHLGDQIAVAHPELPVLNFQSVAGRCNDSLTLSSGRIIHSEAFAHIVRDFTGICGYQVIFGPDDALSLHLQTEKDLAPEYRKRILQRLTKLDQTLSNTVLRDVRQLQHSIAGKTPTIIRRR